jgi:hypothetical protein
MADPNRSQLLMAAATALMGVLVVTLIYLHPEGLRVPAWVAYVAGSAFVLAGLCILAVVIGAVWLQRLLGVAVALSLFVVGSWVAFGPGQRECSISLSFLQGVGPDILCRSAFAIGAILVGLVIVLAIHRFISRRSEA